MMTPARFVRYLRAMTWRGAWIARFWRLWSQRGGLIWMKHRTWRMILRMAWPRRPTNFERLLADLTYIATTGFTHVADSKIR
jgi:hypothetical protein